MPGVKKLEFLESQIAGGDGIENDEPPFRGGIDSGDQPRPRFPSVQ
jgi:hypothetical protein